MGLVKEDKIEKEDLKEADDASNHSISINDSFEGLVLDRKLNTIEKSANDYLNSSDSPLKNNQKLGINTQIAPSISPIIF